MPDQTYHDVGSFASFSLGWSGRTHSSASLSSVTENVRTSDDALLTIKLMIFFELVRLLLSFPVVSVLLSYSFSLNLLFGLLFPQNNIEKMLDSTHDVISDFVNSVTAGVSSLWRSLSHDPVSLVTRLLRLLLFLPRRDRFHRRSDLRTIQNEYRAAE
jgi:hypothetical protein